MRQLSQSTKPSCYSASIRQQFAALLLCGPMRKVEPDRYSSGIPSVGSCHACRGISVHACRGVRTHVRTHVCMQRYMHAHMQRYTYFRPHCAYRGVCVHAEVYTYVRVCACRGVRVHAELCTHTYACVHAEVYILTSTCVHAAA